MKKALFITAAALALVGCNPQQGTSPTDSGTSTGQGSSSFTNQAPSGGGSSTSRTNQSSSSRSQQGSSSSQTPSQTKPDQP